MWTIFSPGDDAIITKVGLMSPIGWHQTLVLLIMTLLNILMTELIMMTLLVYWSWTVIATMIWMTLTYLNIMTLKLWKTNTEAQIFYILSNFLWSSLWGNGRRFPSKLLIALLRVVKLIKGMVSCSCKDSGGRGSRFRRNTRRWFTTLCSATDDVDYSFFF